MTRKRISMTVVITLLCCLTPLASSAWTATGRVVGTAQDSTGVVAPNATVTATNGGAHIFGAHDRAINITLDGIDANETPV